MSPSTAPLEIMTVIGTRPEAIKMAPVVRALSSFEGLIPIVVSTGQHRELLAGALDALGIIPDLSLDVMEPEQSLNQLLGKVVRGVGTLIEETAPAAILVQGDTTTVLGAALAAFHKGIPVGHVEAGLRTYDLEQPFPEEANRQLVDRISRWCFAPTAGSRGNLLSEGLPEERIFVTGNTSVDTILNIISNLGLTPDHEEDYLLITLHRRESFGAPLRNILEGVSRFLEDHPGARVVWPVHPNPNVKRVAAEFAAAYSQAELCEPVAYDGFANLLARARVILSDSGGIQEEAPSLGKPVLVAREATERPEGLEAGNRLVGRDAGTIHAALAAEWDGRRRAQTWPAPNPFGDGTAGQRIAEVLGRDLISATADATDDTTGARTV